MMLWRKRNGEDAFTGVVQLSRDHPEHGPATPWQFLMGHDVSYYELVDFDDCDGPMVLIDPHRFMQIMSEFD